MVNKIKVFARLLSSSQSVNLRSFSISSKRLTPDDRSVGDTLYTTEHRELQGSLSKIIEKDINPYVDQWEAEGHFPVKEVFKKLGKAGFLGVHKPQEYGGLGLDYSFNFAFLEELGSIRCGRIPLAISVQTDMATPALARFGSDKVKRDFLAPSITGDYVSCIGVSEVDAGSDVANIQTRASRIDDDYIINGGKVLITNVYQADWMCLLVKTGGNNKQKNKSLICLPMKTEGVKLAKKAGKQDLRSSDTTQVFFEDVRVPKDYIIGEEGMGFVYQTVQFQEERLAGSALCLIALENVLKETIKYCREKKAFGKPILYNQAVYFRLAELATELDALRCLMYTAVKSLVQGNDVTRLASMCKLKSGRLGREITDSCLQYWSGMGLTNEFLVSRVYRDVRLGLIGGGADEVMLSVIAKKMDMLPPSKEY